MSTRHDLVLNVAGPLRLTDAEGKDRTPRLKRAQAILALLSVAPDLRRSRAWIQDHLWSDKRPDRGAAAQRYALWELRRDLGPARDALLQGAGWIGLDDRRIEVRLPEGELDHGNEAEFAEGLDVPDAEFENWLRDVRQSFRGNLAETEPEPELTPKPARSPPMPPLVAPRSVLEVLPVETDDSGLSLQGNGLLTAIATRVARSCGASVRVSRDVAGEPRAQGRHIRLQLRLSVIGEGIFAQIVAMDCRRDDIVWTTERIFETDASLVDPADPLASIASRQIAHAFATAPLQATEGELISAGWCSALAEPSHFQVTALVRQETALRLIPFPDLQGLVAARRALLLSWSVIERGVATDPAALEEAQMLVRQAVEWDPGNPEVLAVASELVDFQRNPELEMDFAMRAMALDPRHPLANASMAKALARSGNNVEAYKMALKAQQMATGSPNSGWWSMLPCVAAVSCGDYKGALRHARVANALDPDFRPPLRFLSVLSFAEGNRSAAADALTRLQFLEPDFSPEILPDPSYPLRSFPKTLLKQIARAGLIS